MKKQFDTKKLVLLNLPYLLMGLFATNFGEAWRLAQGTNASEKFLSLFAVLPGALQSFWPSLHPLDFLVGLCCGGGLRLAVYYNMVFTSNRDPAQWKENFCENDALLCALDRIFDDAVVFTIKGESFRGRKLETVALRTSAGSPADPQQAG